MHRLFFHEESIHEVSRRYLENKIHTYGQAENQYLPHFFQSWGHKKPTDRRHMQLTFYRSKYFKMPSFLSYNSSKDLVPNQGSVEILNPDRGHILLSFPYKFPINQY